MESLQHIIHMKRELLARETFSRQTINYSEDMPADQKDRYIQYLLGKVNELDLDKRAMELAVEEFQGIHTNVLEQLAELQKSIAEVKTELHEERRRRKSAEAKARKLDQQLKYAQKNKFGNKRQNARKDSDSKEDVDREDEKDRFDGTGGTASTKSVQEHPAEDRPVKEKKERATCQTAPRSMTPCRLRVLPSSIPPMTPKYQAGLSSASRSRCLLPTIVSSPP